MKNNQPPQATHHANHDSAAPRQHPLICTGAKRMHQVHGQPTSRAPESMLRNRITFPPFSRRLGNLGEPSTRHTLRSLRISCCPVATTLSSALTALCLLSCPSSLLLWVWLACCGLRKCLFHRLQTGVALHLLSSTCTKPPNPSTYPYFSTTAPAPIPINFPILPQ